VSTFVSIPWNTSEAKKTFGLICVLYRKCETPFHYALRGPHSVRATVFETLMRRFNKPQDVLQKILNMNVRRFLLFVISFSNSFFFFQFDSIQLSSLLWWQTFSSKGPEGDCYTIVKKYAMKDIAPLLSGFCSLNRWYHSQIL
jgi:hypothetical protein